MKDGGQTGTDLAVNPNPVTSRMVGDVTETLVDATWDNQWVYLDFERGLRADVTDPASDRSWDLGLQRFKFKSNGGVSGNAGVEVALVPDVTLDQVTHAPATGWAVDQPDGPDGNMDPDFVFNQGDTWFAYDVNTHVLSARKRIYVVLTADGNHFGVQIDKYYDETGTGGFVLFRWKKLQPPQGQRVPAAPVAASDGGASGDAGVDAGTSPDVVAQAF